MQIYQDHEILAYQHYSTVLPACLGPCGFPGLHASCAHARTVSSNYETHLYTPSNITIYPDMVFLNFSDEVGFERPAPDHAVRREAVVGKYLK